MENIIKLDKQVIALLKSAHFFNHTEEMVAALEKGSTLPELKKITAQAEHRYMLWWMEREEQAIIEDARRHLEGGE
jgi:hypothetical protein